MQLGIKRTMPSTAHGPKRILYVMATADIGGAERATLLFASNHDPGAYKSEILFLNDGPLVREAASLGLFTHHLGRPLRLSRPYLLARAVHDATKTVVGRGIDLVHSCMPYSHLVGGTAAALSGRPSVLFQHGPVGGVLDQAASLVPTALVLANSLHTAECHRRVALIPARLRTISLATTIAIADSEAMAMHPAINQRLGLAASDLVIGLMARLTPGKGIDFAIGALAPLLRSDPSLKLLIVGGPFRHFFPAYQQELEALAAAERVAGQVIFAGPQPDVRPFLARTDILLSASFSESFGLTLIEGMAAGKAIVASCIGGAAEIIRDGEDGVYFPCGDAEALRRTVAALLADPAQRQRLGKAGLATARERYSIPVMMRQLEDAYAEVLHRP
jgi:glycosyltransferase involved in cell wall biosynthesis